MLLVFPLKSLATSCAEQVGTIVKDGFSYQEPCPGGGYIEISFLNMIPDSNLSNSQFGGIINHHSRKQFVSCSLYSGNQLVVVDGVQEGNELPSVFRLPKGGFHATSFF